MKRKGTPAGGARAVVFWAGAADMFGHTSKLTDRGGAGKSLAEGGQEGNAEMSGEKGQSPVGGRSVIEVCQGRGCLVKCQEDVDPFIGIG